MSYYRGKYNPNEERLFKLSRSKVESYVKCKRCFYLDRRLGIGQPPGFPFNLNSAVDNLLKNEFDCYRNIQEPHPYIIKLGLNAVPFQHDDIEKWRANFTGVSYDHIDLKFHLFGAVDDLWINLDNQELIVVDYKSTSKSSDISIDAPWQRSYKRQMEFYQFLLRKNGFQVSNTGYFVYCNGDRSKEKFNEVLEFKMSLIPYTGSDSWVEPTLSSLHQLLNQDEIPKYNENCDYCLYQQATAKTL